MKRELFRTTGESDAPQLPHLFARFRDRRAQSPRRQSFFRAIPPVRSRLLARAPAESDAFDRLLLSEILTRTLVHSSSPGAVSVRPSPFDAVRSMTLVPRLAPRAHPRDVASRAVPPIRRRP